MTNSSVEKLILQEKGKSIVKQLKEKYPRSGYVAFCCWN
jgi:hypothetical protein